MTDAAQAMPDAVDVVVIGGGAAGLAGALQLVRQRRSVLVVDAGEPRNAPAHEMHGYLGFDGRSPAELVSTGRAEVAAYGGRLVSDAVVEVTGADGGFAVALGSGSVVGARRILVATGGVDVLPDVPGLAEHWGEGVLHCPYCHGYEVRGQRVVVLGTGERTAHQALLFRQQTDDVAVVLHGGVLGADDRALLSARGVRIHEGPAAEVVSGAEGVEGVRLADGTVVPTDAVVVAPAFEARAGMFVRLGLFPELHPAGTGTFLATAQGGTTRIPGIWAAGNVADPMAQVLQSAAAGSTAGIMINADLVIADAEAALP